VTLDEVVDAALARAMEFSATVPHTRSVCYRRVNARQQQLFTMIAGWNPAYSGAVETLALTAGACDLSDLDPAAERVTDVRIEDIGTSPYANGQQVNIVRIEDQTYAALPPRATLRDFVLEGVGNDLALVTSVTVAHARRAATLALGDDDIEISDGFSELLVLDLAKHMIAKHLAMPQAERAAVLELWNAEEADLLATYQTHVRQYGFAETARHG
jgi:hypothetical protein